MAVLMAVLIFIIAFIIVVTEKSTGIHKSMPMMISGAIIWCIASLAGKEGFHEHMEHTKGEVFGIVFFLLAAILWVNAMERFGLFIWIGHLISRISNHSVVTLWIYSAGAFFLSPLIDNMTTSLIFGSLIAAQTAFLAERGDTAITERFAVVMAISVGFAANAGGAWNPFGDPPTLMAWLAHKAEFGDLLGIFVPALVSMLVCTGLLTISIPKIRIEVKHHEGHIPYEGLLLALLFLVLIFVVIASEHFFHVDPSITMTSGIGILGTIFFVLHKKNGASSERDFWQLFGRAFHHEGDTLMFFAGVLVAIGGLAHLGVLNDISQAIYGYFSADWANLSLGLVSAVVDNVPMMAAVIKMDPPLNINGWLLVIYAMGIGGSLLSIGSAAGLALMSRLGNYGYNFASHLRLAWAPAIGYFAGALLLMGISGQV